MVFTINEELRDSVVLVFTDVDVAEDYRQEVAYLKEKEIFTGKAEETYTIHDLKAGKTTVLLGMGAEGKVTLEQIRRGAFKAAKALNAAKAEEASVKLPKFSSYCYKVSTRAFAEGFVNADYRFDKYMTKKKEASLKKVSLLLLSGKEDKILPVLEGIQHVMDGVFLARDLVNEPAIVMTPQALADAAVEALSPLGVEVSVLGKAEAEELKMDAFLAVAKGSAKEPKVIIMRYKGDDADADILGFVGKGVTYDTGGYSLKPSDGMVTMYGDMGGAGSVIGAMKAIALNKVKRNITAVICATENMISGDAYKPGDIIGSMAGKTIEVLNTDAEGRLTLADAIHYIIEKEGVKEVVDIATLTGACVVALGEITTGAFTNDQALMDKVLLAAKQADEPTWQMPLTDEYKELVKGTNADLKNVAGRWGGAITAAAFLNEFAGKTPWVHLDIAGTALISAARGYLPKGATGVPVKTLYLLARQKADQAAEAAREEGSDC